MSIRRSIFEEVPKFERYLLHSRTSHIAQSQQYKLMLVTQTDTAPEPINRHKTSSDLLAVRFPTFVYVFLLVCFVVALTIIVRTRRSRASSKYAK